MSRPFTIVSIDKLEDPARTRISYLAGLREFSLDLDGHDFDTDPHSESIHQIVEDHFVYCLSHGLSNFSSGTYAEDVREDVLKSLNRLGYLDDDGHIVFNEEQVVEIPEVAKNPDPDDQPTFEELDNDLVQKLIKRVIENSDYAGEAGYAIRILYNLDIEKNDFIVGLLWSEMKWFLNHEDHALKGEQFDRTPNVMPANKMRKTNAKDDRRAIEKIARKLGKDNYLSRQGKLKIRPYARAILNQLELDTTPRNCGISKIEKILTEIHSQK